MEGLLIPVSTTYKSQEKKEEVLLSPVSTSYKLSRNTDRDALIEASNAQASAVKLSMRATTPEEALEVLKNEPDHERLILTLRYLTNTESHILITSPSPISSQLVHVLVSETLPNYWNVLSVVEGIDGKQKNPKRSPDVELLLKCLRSVTGLNAILLSLKRHTQLSKDSKRAKEGPKAQDVLRVLLQALVALLQGSDLVEKIWQTLWKSSIPLPQKNGIWKEFVNLVGGKIIGISAEAEDVVKDLSQSIEEKYWISDSGLFSSWLTSNVQHWTNNLSPGSEGWKFCAEILSKVFRLSKIENVVGELLGSLVIQSNDRGARFINLLTSLPTFEQRNILYATLQFLSKNHLSTSITTEADSSWWKSDAKVISGTAGLVALLIANEESRARRGYLISWLTGSTGAGVGEGIAIRRAVMAALADDKSDLENILEKSIQLFGDQLYIRHTPTMQQEAHAQVLLLAAGWVHRKAPHRLAIMMRSGIHLSAISNRLAASSPRTRFLGMVVGEALSGLVDKGDKIMSFKVEETGTSEAKWYKGLVNVIDTIGLLDSLRSKPVATTSKKPQPRPSKPANKPNKLQGTSKIISIEEVTDDDEENKHSDDDLAPYAKPDEDAEDSDEDATNIVRNKPTAPVYVRDLITYLRDTDNYDRQRLGLTTAASLIRRKANFGTEVSSHAEELATLLVGMQDKYEIEGFQELRQQGMIAILIALPSKMGQWFSKTFFDGDYSISQRAAVLTALGLGAREIAGYGQEDAKITKSAPLPSKSFPSKVLPANMHNVYASSTKDKPKPKQLPFSAITALSTNLTTSFIRPLAASAADSSLGPNILKTRTFSSRMAVSAARPKPTSNALSKLVGPSFFFPLTGRFFVHLRAYGPSSTKNISFDPFLLSLFIKTLALILDAAGSNTVGRAEMVSEFWDLLLGLRIQASGEIGILEALLFGFLVIMEGSNDQRALVERFGRQLLETQGWVEGVFSRFGSISGIRGLEENGGGGEEEKVRVLVTGVLVQIRECVEKYQALLMGDLTSFS